MDEKRDWWIVEVGGAEWTMHLSSQEVWLLGEQFDRLGLRRDLSLERYRRGYCPGCGVPAHIAHGRLCLRAVVAVGSEADRAMFHRRWAVPEFDIAD